MRLLLTASLIHGIVCVPSLKTLYKDGNCCESTNKCATIHVEDTVLTCKGSGDSDCGSVPSLCSTIPGSFARTGFVLNTHYKTTLLQGKDGQHYNIAYFHDEGNTNAPDYDPNTLFVYTHGGVDDITVWSDAVSRMRNMGPQAGFDWLGMGMSDNFAACGAPGTEERYFTTNTSVGCLDFFGYEQQVAILDSFMSFIRKNRKVVFVDFREGVRYTFDWSARHPGATKAHAFFDPLLTSGNTSVGPVDPFRTPLRLKQLSGIAGLEGALEQVGWNGLLLSVQLPTTSHAYGMTLVEIMEYLLNNNGTWPEKQSEAFLSRMSEKTVLTGFVPKSDSPYCGTLAWEYNVPNVGEYSLYTKDEDIPQYTQVLRAKNEFQTSSYPILYIRAFGAPIITVGSAPDLFIMNSDRRISVAETFGAAFHYAETATSAGDESLLIGTILKKWVGEGYPSNKMYSNDLITFRQ
jgi:hypothetical protein